jgi:hypothetical protein
VIDLHAGDCRTILASLPDASVDAVVTDPPYELGFMGKKWDGTGIAYDVAMWAEVLRVLKPGGHLLSFGGTRTWHRMACAVEDAGFEMRDSIAWLYGSGFPKSLDVGKAIDKAAGAERERSAVGATACPDFPADCGGHPSANGSLGGGVMRHAFPTAPATPDAAKWDGWGTALKPAHEPIVVARKPFTTTVAGNVVEYGTGALNIDACRIGTSDTITNHGRRPTANGWDPRMSGGQEAGQTPGQALGRWPANVVLDDTTATILDEQSGTLTTGAMNGNRNAPKFGGAAASTYSGGTFTGEEKARPGDSGGASRFFYCAKAPTKERPRHDDGTAHPTVKPLTLMRWLVRLVTPPGGTVLEPFAGSGTTLEAALLEGFHAIGIEANEDYLPLIRQRLARHEPTLFGATA